MLTCDTPRYKKAREAYDESRRKVMKAYDYGGHDHPAVVAAWKAADVALEEAAAAELEATGAVNYFGCHE